MKKVIQEKNLENASILPHSFKSAISALFTILVLLSSGALVNTPAIAQSTPYLGGPLAVPGTIQIEDFDNGGQGVAYNDLDVSNQGGAYRMNDRVDIEATSDASGGGYNVGWARTGEWLQYTVNVAAAGTYTIEVRVACPGNGGTFHIEFNGIDKTGPIVVPNTGNWQAWQTISKTGVALNAGQQIMRIVFDIDGAFGTVGNLNYINIPGGSAAVPPSISTHPSNQSVNVGQTATFNVSATGSTPFAYQWQKNNANIGGATGASYTTPATSLGDNGSTYRCIVSNSVGTATSNSATLSVSSSATAPTISSHPSNQSVAVGQTATFNVSATGTAPLAYQWQKNNANIGGATSTSYTTPATSLADNGSTYRCIVSNGAGTATSNAATLTVTGSSSTQTPYLGGPFAVPGTIQVEDFDNGGEGIAYHDLDVSNQGGVYRTNEGVDIQATSGGYNAGWTRTGEWLEYTVNVATAGTYTIEARVACSGNGGTLHIEFDGVDKTGPMVVPNTGDWQSWQTISKAGVALSAGQQIMRIAFDTDGPMGTTGNLNYINITSGGSSTTPPTISSHPSNQSVTVGQTATFNVSATGTAPLGYQWQKNNANIGGATSTSYTTPATSLADNGSTYRCIVSNSVGTATSNAATLTVTGSSSTQTPYLGAPFAIPGTIQVEDFDNGGEGIAYHDLDVSNQGGGYRTSEAVDIQATSDAGNGYNAGWTRAGEWLEYTVNVATAGTYMIEVRVACTGNGGTLHIELDGVDKTGPMVVPNTGNWQAWQTISKTGVALNAGQQILRLALDTDGPSGTVGNINYVAVTVGGSSSAPSITSHPANQSVTVGQTATFNVSATGTAPLAYQWQKNNANIGGATGTSYTTPATSLGDNGSTYRCIVSNSTGTATSNAATLTVQGSSSTLSFQLRTIDSNNPRNPHCKAIGDINGDGLIDVLAASSSGFTEGLYWYKYPSWTKYSIRAGSFSTSMQVADIDGDGDLDAIIPKGNDYGSSVFVYVNPRPSGNPESGSWQEVYLGDAGAHDVEIGDMNSDGKPDVVVRLGGELTIFFQNTLTSWTKRTLSTRSFEGTAIGDIDADGDMDIAINGYWLQNPLPGGNPTTAAWTERVVNSSWGTQLSVHIADVNSDGRKDILFAPSEYTGANVAWYESTTPLTGPWTEHVIQTNAGLMHTLKTADMDGDGDQDVVTAEMHQSSDPDEVAVYRNGGGGLSWTKVVVATTGSHNARLGDIGNDGDIDIVGANWNNGAPAGAPIQYWENLGGGSTNVTLDSWQRHIIDANKPWKAIFITGTDMDGDGRKDIVTGGWWYRNPGSPAGSWTRNTIGSPLNNMATVYDFDGNGSMDVLGTQGTSESPNANFVWARNNGSGSFTIVNNVQSGNGDFLQGVQVAQYQGGVREVALSWHSGGVGIQMLAIPANPSTGTWTWRQASTTSQDEQISAGDIDRDGDIDLALGTQWLRNDGSSWAAFTLNSSSGMPDRNRLADINRDGRLDVVIGFEAISAVGKFTWYEQPASATGTWTERTISSSVVGPMSMDVADMDLDGDIDVVVGEHNLNNPGSARLLVFENVNNGASWVQHVVFTGDEHHDGAQIVDIDNDGDLDILSIGWNNPRVTLYENRAIGGSSPTIAAQSETGSIKIIPKELGLAQNYPNPFNPSTSIKVDLPKAARVSLKVYDIIGRELQALVSEAELQPGSHTYQFNASKYASGMYIYRLIVDGKLVGTKTMILMK